LGGKLLILDTYAEEMAQANHEAAQFAFIIAMEGTGRVRSKNWWPPVLDRHGITVRHSTILDCGSVAVVGVKTR
jgi:hypothetical protein